MRTVEELVQEVRSFPVADRLRLVERIVHELADASSGAREASPPGPKVSPLGWLADDPELADQLEKLTAGARARGRARGLDDENPR
ncbi:hypothetical protein SOCEGT47_060300 [Sorangium cellulosum]|uniref:Uncharacterized protein n=1 Tax=Sorangium cellulosum TaxID=56 RepID=A0A4P2Q8U8_SORCE|nr:hypothetical protein SOCEGT47_060300 [Sorangium cellulosum]